MLKLYIFKFKPIFKEKIWGGHKIKTILKKNIGNRDNCGETWELSGVKGDISIVSNGQLRGKNLAELVEAYKDRLVGQSIYKKFGNEFPLLIKFIDAAQDLSIQVHPNDTLAKAKHNGFGKTEMWYIMEADSTAKLINGFKKDTNKKEFLEALYSKQLMGLLHEEEVQKGDVYYLPAGRVHTIGKGLLLAEIQQTSDLTYRIYDFDRVDKDGNKRKLHTVDALEAIDFKKPKTLKSTYSLDKNKVNSIISTSFFSTNKLSLDKPKVISENGLDCFKIYLAVSGKGKIAGEPISFGEVALVPAEIKTYTIEPIDVLELLEIYIEC